MSKFQPSLPSPWRNSLVAFDLRSLAQITGHGAMNSERVQTRARGSPLFGIRDSRQSLCVGLGHVNGNVTVLYDAAYLRHQAHPACKLIIPPHKLFQRKFKQKYASSSRIIWNFCYYIYSK